MHSVGDPSVKHSRAGWTNLRTWLRRAGMFTAGVVATLAALFVFHLAFPAPKPLTVSEINDAVSAAMASATPPPANSALVFQVIQPSLVLIQTKSNVSTSGENDGLGSGVIIDAGGDILTCLHVVYNVDSIQVTFSDGTQSNAQVKTTQPLNDIAVLQPDHLPSQVVPAVLGNPKSMNVGDEAYVVGNPFGLFESMSAGVISGLTGNFNPLTVAKHITD